MGNTFGAEEWDHRFAGLLALQDQGVMGRGAAGFDLGELDWEELGYEPPHAAAYLARFRQIVEAFEPPASAPGADVLPLTGAVACCVPHRVLSALPHWEGCVFCHR
ncbi:hypothetical protein [Streptomyces sp. V4I2]|uniref:hypothetical protein n=1 Tax=Streptomyces sp. V4I2 TaxID=3042280 RepID=UPI002788BAC7|nr:hypothetical protein [Streptomyces sp. V4I2]MDQ1044003.1 hypothetical protein [Streptomyces sp. V4I2]